ncbi:MAG: hypothetical protein RL591_980, partial [Planctomycetota bacterium]
MTRVAATTITTTITTTTPSCATLRSMSRHVVIVGAGIAGLAAARTLADAGYSVEMHEAADRVGGRVASDTIRGFTIDRGFQIYLSAYPEAKRFLDRPDCDLRALDLKAFMPGALVWNGTHAATIAHPLREPLAAITGVLRGVVPPADALRMIPFARRALSGPSDGPGPSGTTALARLTAAGISRRTIDRFFRPFFGGVFFDSTLSTDAGRLDFLLRMFAEGFACVPANGMGEIPKLMLAAAPSVRVRLGSRVERVESRAVVLASGERIEADAVILATGAHDLERLLAPIAPDFPQTAWCGTFSAWFATPDASLLPRWLVLNGSGRGSFNHGAAMSAIAPSYAPSGRGLFVANTTFLPRNSDDSRDIAADMQRTLREILGRDATEGWELLAAQRIRHAIPRQWPQD